MAHVDKKRKHHGLQLYEKIQRSEIKVGTPTVELRTFLADPPTVDVIGVSFSAGQPISGVETGPSLMIRAVFFCLLREFWTSSKISAGLLIVPNLFPHMNTSKILKAQNRINLSRMSRRFLV